MDPGPILESAGPWMLAVVAAMVFIESGVLFPFLPGDSLLFTAGLMHQRMGISLPVLITVIALAAIAGDLAGYVLGRYAARRLFKPGNRLLKTDHLHPAEDFFARYGGRALILARFVPLVRTYTPLVAGAARLPWVTFLAWNIAGAVLWSVSLTVLGSLLGGVDFVSRNIDVILVAIIVTSLLPALIGFLRQRITAGRHESASVAEPAADPEA